MRLVLFVEGLDAAKGSGPEEGALGLTRVNIIMRS